MKTLIVSIFLFLCICSYSFDTTSIKYFPLNVGNVYVYKYIKTQYWDTIINTSVRVQIIGEAIMDSHKYYNFVSTSNFMNQLWFRVDSTTGNKMQYTGTYCPYYGNEILSDSLAASPGNLFWTGCHSTFPNQCFTTGPVVLFGVQTVQKILDYSYPHTYDGRTYVKLFGLYLYKWTVYIYTETYTLKGCIVNSVLYGDTSLTGIIQVSSEIPDDYSLSQNFPNPFNPITKIRFSIALLKGGGGMISTKLILYNILGRELATLVNEELKPGTYEVEWDGNNYSSGVYFYKLVADDFVETKKLVLVK